MILTCISIKSYILGGFGYDFSSNIEVFSEGLDVVSKGLLQHGVTSFCPTLVTSPVNVYRQVICF